MTEPLDWGSKKNLWGSRMSRVSADLKSSEGASNPDGATRPQLSVKRFWVVAAVLFGVALAGCGSKSDSEQRSENVSSLQKELGKLPYSLETSTDSPSPITGQSGEGILSGTIKSKDGVSMDFTFSVGPDPQKLSGSGGSWIGGGDQFYLRTREGGQHLSKQQLRKQDDMYLDLEDAGCQVVLGDNCPV